MSERQTSGIGMCAFCGALNATGRQTCIQCHRSLKGFFWRVSAESSHRSPLRFALGRVQRRREPRTEVSLTGYVLEEEGITRQRILVRNISPSGLMFCASMPYSADSPLRVAMDVEGRSYTFYGAVRYSIIAHLGRMRTFATGIELQERSPLMMRIMARMEKAGISTGI